MDEEWEQEMIAILFAFTPSVMAHFHVFIIFLNFFPSDTEISIVIFTFFMKF